MHFEKINNILGQIIILKVLHMNKIIKRLCISTATLLLSQASYATAENSIENGKYIAIAGDCAACHTSNEADPFAGGVSFPTPFGVIYSTNITPNKEQGIGHYSFQDFSETLRTGVAPIGNLYPAMPFTSYHKMSDADMTDLWAYLQSIPESKTPNLENSMMFPANIRMGLKGWNLLFLGSGQYEADKTKSDEWNRGAYLIEGWTHCGECHTPRNIFMASKTAPELQLSGSVLGSVMAPDIRTKELIKQGWTRQSLTQLLHKGYSEQGVANHEMLEVVSKSLKFLTKDDINAIVTRLLDSKDASAEGEHPIATVANKSLVDSDNLYAYNCAGCHAANGEGTSFAPPLQSNATIRATNPTNLITFILKGIPASNANKDSTFVAMPAQAQVLSDQQITTLANLLRASWSTAEDPEITADQVKEIRESLIESGDIKAVKK